MNWRVVLREGELQSLVSGCPVNRVLRPKTREAAVTIEIILDDIGLDRIERVVQLERSKAMDIQSRIDTGDLPQGYELTSSDVGCQLGDRRLYGIVLRQDVGRRCWTRRDISLESTQERDKRLART